MRNVELNVCDEIENKYPGYFTTYRFVHGDFFFLNIIYTYMSIFEIREFEIVFTKLNLKIKRLKLK